MPKKPQVQPPRRVQAPQVRHDPKQPRTPQVTSKTLVVGVAVIGVAAMVIAVVAFAVSRGSSDPTTALRAAGCTAKALPDQGANHIQDLSEKVRYNSFPPTSGSHYFQPAIFNEYSEPIDQKMGIHNLEHGGVLIQYGKDVARAQVDQLSRYWRADPNGLIVAPLPKLGDEIALTAWTQLALCPRFDKGAFDAFLDAYRFKGPERLPPEALQPGS